MIEHLSLYVEGVEVSEVGLLGGGAQSRELSAMLHPMKVRFVAVSHEFLAPGFVDFAAIRLTDLPLMAAVGSPGLRRDMVSRFPNHKFASAYLQWSFLDEAHSVGAGTIVAPGSIVSTNVTIGSHVLINLGVSVSHDAVIGDFVTVSPGVTIAGGVVLGNGCFVGAGASLVDGTSLAEGVLVGAGAVVTKSISEPGTYVGVPARRIGDVTGWDALKK